MNERKTEDIVYETLRQLAYLRNKKIFVEKQSSDSPVIQKLLKSASKKGEGIGKPEYIIRHSEYTDLLIIIECKADIRKHESRSKDKYCDYAVDGVLLYASYLSKQYDVIAIAVSGQKKSELRISQFLHLRGTDKSEKFVGDQLLSFENYFNAYKHNPKKFKIDYQNLLDYSQDLNEILHAKKVKESQRSLLISGILIALQNRAFTKGYSGHHTARQLAESLVNTIVNELQTANLPTQRVENLKHAYSFIYTHKTLSNDKEFLEDLIDEIDQRINSFIKTYHYYDTISQFYIEFLRYANNDKGLGIVLTPPHITELFCKLVNLSSNSVVIDNCCGTGGFLINALRLMVNNANKNDKKIKDIKDKQIVGIEFQDDIYALAISNMIIHGDGKSNIFNDDCFKMVKEIKNKYRPTVGLLNPPYKTEKSDIEEFEFIINNLEMLQTNGKCVAILPISCVIANKGIQVELKRKLLEKHTLEAVMSMPDSLFHDSNVGVVTCAIVLTAHVPHPKNYATWFGYWKDDGFIKTKHKGRIDNGNWSKIEKAWIEDFTRRREKKGLNVLRKVTPEDEWCAEAYMKTDYSTLTKKDYIRYIKEYVLFKLN